MAEVKTGQLERMLGPDWRTLGYVELSRRARSLETAAGFARTLGLYMLDAEYGPAGEALAALSARNGNVAG